MNIIYNFEDLDLKLIGDSDIGKFVKLSNLLCSDGVIRKGNLSNKTTRINKKELMGYLDINSEKSFSTIFNSLEKYFLLKRVQLVGKGFTIYVNPKYCRTQNYKTNKICEDLFELNKIQNIEEYFLYRFLDKFNNIIYIGRTNNIKNRMSQHFKNGHLPEECYNSIYKIEYAEIKTYVEMCIYEIYYINKEFPIYNKKSKDSTQKEINIKLPEIEWKILETS